MNYTFDSVFIDADKKTINILNGTTGTYNISDIKKISVLNEGASFKGKTEPFKHQMLGGASTFIAVEPKLYVGIRLITIDNQTLAIYISKIPVLFNSDPYLKDVKEADKIKRIITKELR